MEKTYCPICGRTKIRHWYFTCKYCYGTIKMLYSPNPSKWIQNNSSGHPNWALAKALVFHRDDQRKERRKTIKYNENVSSLDSAILGVGKSVPIKKKPKGVDPLRKPKVYITEYPQPIIREPVKALFIKVCEYVDSQPEIDQLAILFRLDEEYTIKRACELLGKSRTFYNRVRRDFDGLLRDLCKDQPDPELEMVRIARKLRIRLTEQTLTN